MVRAFDLCLLRPLTTGGDTICVHASTTVETGTPSSFAIDRQLEPEARSLRASSRSKSRNGRPRVLPSARACRMPESVRSRIISRSNSAIPGRMVSMRREAGLDASVSMPWDTAINRTPCRSSAAIASVKWRTDRPNRSILYTKTQSMRRRVAAAISLSRAGRLAFEPEKPESTYSTAGDHPRRWTYSRSSRSCISQF
jgi:hypothetical protein